MDKKAFGKNEQGVVLLTCLVFLLVLLLMLRFVLVSAKTEEQKAGIDLDIVTARESAQSALNFVEYYIREQGIAYCEQVIKEDVSICKGNPLAYANVLFSLNDAALKGTTFKAPAVPEISQLHNNGLYTGSYLTTNASNCDPVWICVKWPTQAHAVVSSAEKQRKAIKAGDANLKFITCPTNSCNTSVAAQPVFLIERLMPYELDPDASGLGNSSLYINGSKGVILRVTVVGFGAGNANSNNLTSVMLQSIYVLPNS